MRLLPGIAVVLAVIGASGCGGSESADNPLGRDFVATSVFGVHGPNPSVDDLESIRMDFSDTGDAIGWSAGCNMLGAEAEIKRSKIEIDQITSTELACEAGMQAEQWFFLEGFLHENPKWRLAGSTLTLTSDRAVIELRPAKDRGTE